MPEIADAGLRLAIYARVSTEEQREGQTIDSQVKELEQFSREKGWIIAGTYKDDGWSGGVMERPELDRLRDDAQRGVFEAVLINDVDRLARDVAHLGVIKRDLEKKGAKVLFRKLPSDTSPTYNLMVNILGSFAEFERELISDRTRRGRRHKIEVRKQYLGSNTAYGYRYVPMDRLAGTQGLLRVASEEAGVVQRMFEWVDQEGLSAKRVLKRLNDLKIPARKGGRWGKSSVLRILKNEMYAGTWHYNKHQSYEPPDPSAVPRYRKRVKYGLRLRPRNEWLPLTLPESLRLVPLERWKRVQEQLARNLCFSPRNEKHVYLLKSLVRCGACGARYVGTPCHGKFYYRCHARCDQMPSITEQILNDAVKKAVKNIMINPGMILEPLRQLDEADKREAGNRQTTAQSIEQEVKRIEAEEQRVLDAYRTGIISPAQLGQQLEKMKDRRAALELQQVEIGRSQQLTPERIECAVTDYCAAAARNLASFTEDRWREFLRTIVETITFYGSQIRIAGRVPPGTQKVPEGGGFRFEVPVTAEQLPKT